MIIDAHKSHTPQSHTPHAPPPTLTDDGFLDGRLQCLQPEKGFRAGLDAVFLAAAIPALPGESLLEAGSGAGVAALCAARRIPGLNVTGVEVSTRYALIAEENARRNGLAGHVRMIHADIRDGLRQDLAIFPQHGSFAHAMANPPFYQTGTNTPPADPMKAQAHSFEADDLALWVKVMHHMVCLRGTVTLIHRADALGHLLEIMDKRFGDIRVFPLFPRGGEPASRVIVQGIKGSRAPLQLLPGLIIHEAGPGFSKEARAVLREGEAIALHKPVEHTAHLRQHPARAR